MSRTIERFGRIDLLINNAGAGLYAPSHMASMEEARRMWELNFFAPLDLIQRVAPAMKRQRSGFIVNVGSIAGKVTLPWFTLYSASKYAIGSLTDGLRMELRQFGIHTMTVCPGYVNTRFREEDPSRRRLRAGYCRQRTETDRQFLRRRCAAEIVRGLNDKLRLSLRHQG